MRSPARILVVALFALGPVGCSDPGEDSPGAGDAPARLHLGLAVPPGDADVASVRFEATDPAGRTQTVTVSLETEPLPPAASPDLAGRRFADLFLVVNPGHRSVRATPLRGRTPCSSVTAALVRPPPGRAISMPRHSQSEARSCPSTSSQKACGEGVQEGSILPS